MAMKRKNVAAQVTPTGLVTPYSKSKSPTKEDVVKAANARSEKRHAAYSPSDSEADSLFPGAGSGEVLDKAGVMNDSYVTKKNTPYGVDAMFNTLPPGMDINDQEIADIREQPYKEIVDLSYPGDGWK